MDDKELLRFTTDRKIDCIKNTITVYGQSITRTKRGMRVLYFSNDHVINENWYNETLERFRFVEPYAWTNEETNIYYNTNKGTVILSYFNNSLESITREYINKDSVIVIEALKSFEMED